jgi:hypothetical protein
MAPTNTILHTSTIPTFEEACPRDLVAHRKRSPPLTIDLVNGHRILFLSAASSVEGLNLTHTTLDEIQHPEFVANPSRFSNMQARLRDVKVERPFLMLIAGLPEHGKVREWCDVPETYCVRLKASDNRYLLPGTVEANRRACSHDEVATKIDGEWGAPPDRSFKSYDPRHHVIDQYGDRSRETWMGFDFGRQSCALIGQPDGDGGLLVVDEILAKDQITRDICGAVNRRGWTPSVIAVDPSSSVNRDSLSALQDAYPEATIVRRYSSHQFHSEEFGWSYLSRCLLDGEGITRLRFSRRLLDHSRGLLNALANAKSNDSTGRLVRTKDGGRYSDHPLDACRYLVSLLDDRERGMI